MLINTLSHPPPPPPHVHGAQADTMFLFGWNAFLAATLVNHVCISDHDLSIIHGHQVFLSPLAPALTFV